MPDSGRVKTFCPALSPLALDAFLRRHQTSRQYWLGLSGGLDSTVLAHLASLLQQQRPDFACKLLHVHHGLHPDADKWADYCQKLALSLGLEIQILKVSAHPKSGESPEAAARKARYDALSDTMASGDSLLTAHHQDDQTETLLLQLLRGSGLRGLASMPESKDFGPGYLQRPLLSVSRHEIESYACFHHLEWIDDSSNENTGFDRNFLRHNVIPSLRERWPSLGEAIGRSAHHCAEALNLLNEHTEADLKSLMSSPSGSSISISGLRAFSKEKQKWLLKTWVEHQGFKQPSTRILDHVLLDCLDAGPEQSPLVRWSEGEFRRYRDCLYLLPPHEAPPQDWESEWLDDHIFYLPDALGTLKIESGVAGISKILFERGPRFIRFRRGGEKIKLKGRNGRHELRKLYQEAGIPPWIRELIPLIYIGETLVAVGNLWIDETYLDPDHLGMKIVWDPPSWCKSPVHDKWLQ